MLIAASSPAVDDPGLLLRTRLTGFAGFLRANGYGVGGGDSTRLLETASRVGVFDGDVLRWSLKALLCGRGDEWRRFDALFDAYFLPPNGGVGGNPRRRDARARRRRIEEGTRHCRSLPWARAARITMMVTPSVTARVARNRLRPRISAISFARIRCATSRR
jgi:uncharacterized protein with von Willebrand factor type A (vWA) domain